MAEPKKPKVLLFDIGGVCVVSPFQAILDYELSHSIPPGWISHSISRTSPNGYWHRLERGEISISPEFYTGFSADLHNPTLWISFYLSARAKDPSLPATVPPLPNISAKEVFWKMMDKSRDFDPWMYPALQKLKASGKFILAALSNTVIFPREHPYANPEEERDIRRIFDVFISSAHVGLRKPSPEIYAYALQTLNTYARTHPNPNWDSGIKPEDILFLDDIGENLKAGKKAGFKTIKVSLGRAFEAVDELEKITGLRLHGNHPRVAVLPVIDQEKKEGMERGRGAKL